jgi:ketosteroid isomerase-like protein
VTASDYEIRKGAARANRDFYRAIERADLKAMGALWLRDERVKCVHPGWGLLRGFEEVMSSWEAIFQSPERLQFEVSDLEIEIAGDTARATNVERISGTARETGQQRSSEAVATNVYERVDGVWRMTLHHASPILRNFEEE